MRSTRKLCAVRQPRKLRLRPDARLLVAEDVIIWETAGDIDYMIAKTTLEGQEIIKFLKN